MKMTLENPTLLQVISSDGHIFMGGSQDWFEDSWRRNSGCGPTCASALIWYLARSRQGISSLCNVDNGDKASFLQLMNIMFEYITPGFGGVNSTDIFVIGAKRYASDKGIALQTHVLEIPAMPRQRPTLEGVRQFILSALQSDHPVAFLNLSNGALKNLDNWHLVTLIALEPDSMTATMCDQGLVSEINLALWLETSMLGGGMVALDASCA